MVPLLVGLGHVDDALDQREDAEDRGCDEARADATEQRDHAGAGFAHHELVNPDPAEPTGTEDDRNDSD